MGNRNIPPKGVKPNPQNPPYVQPASEELLRKLTKEHGPPAYPKDSGKGWSQINERFFAELIVCEREIIHEADEESTLSVDRHQRAVDKNQYKCAQSNRKRSDPVGRNAVAQVRRDRATGY